MERIERCWLYIVNRRFQIGGVVPAPRAPGSKATEHVPAEQEAATGRLTTIRVLSAYYLGRCHTDWQGWLRARGHGLASGTPGIDHVQGITWESHDI
jgi:hypothetical protein